MLNYFFIEMNGFERARRLGVIPPLGRLFVCIQIAREHVAHRTTEDTRRIFRWWLSYSQFISFRTQLLASLLLWANGSAACATQHETEMRTKTQLFITIIMINKGEQKEKYDMCRHWMQNAERKARSDGMAVATRPMRKPNAAMVKGEGYIITKRGAEEQNDKWFSTIWRNYQ